MAEARATQAARAWPEADALFRGDSRWLGSDDAYSVPLDDDTTLWLFGDTFVDGADRRRAAFVRNSIGIQRGRDPSRASMEFAWGRAPDGSFFEAPRGEWYWPLHGARIAGELLLFMMRVRSPNGGDGSIEEWRRHGLLGFFEVFGWTALRVTNIGAEPSQWHVEIVVAREEPIVLGASVIAEDRPVIVAGWDEAKRISLARWPDGDVSTEPERWNGTAWSAESPATVIEEGSTEFSIHRARDGWVHVAMGGAEQSLLVRRAPEITGPWSRPDAVFTPSEAGRDGVYVYAGKAHPQLSGDGALVCTYASNADVDTCLDDQSIYYPRFVRVDA